MSALTKYWKQLGPLVAVVAAVANVLGPQWAPGYIIAGFAAMLINLFGPANSTPPVAVPPPVTPSAP